MEWAHWVSYAEVWRRSSGFRNMGNISEHEKTVPVES